MSPDEAAGRVAKFMQETRPWPSEHEDDPAGGFYEVHGRHVFPEHTVAGYGHIAADDLRALIDHARATSLPAPTNSDDEWAEWQVGKFTVASTTPVCIYVEIRPGEPTEIQVPDPVGLARCLLAAHRGEWGPATGWDINHEPEKP